MSTISTYPAFLNSGGSLAKPTALPPSALHHSISTPTDASLAFQVPARGKLPAAGLPRSSQLALQNRSILIPTTRKLIRTQQQAMQLFQRFGDDIDGLLRYLQTELGIIVLSGKNFPWVDKYLTASGTEAVFLAAGSPFYGDHSNELPDVGGHPAETEYYQFMKQLERSGNTAILIKSNQYKKHIVLHEVFHLLQFINGLPWHAHDYKTQEGATAFIMSVYQKLANTFSAFAIGFSRGVKKIFQGMLPEISLKPGGTGAWVRNTMQREFEAIDFLRENRKAFGFSRRDSAREKMRRASYEIVQDLSWRLDKAESKALTS